MKAGELRHRVTIEAPVNGTDGQGGRTSSVWQTIPNGTVWAAISPLSAREIYNAGLIGMTATHEVTIRYLAGVHAGCRVSVHGEDRQLLVSGIIDPDMRKKSLRLTCDEQSPGATA